MIKNNKIIFFSIFIILQLFSIFIYQKQDKKYFFEYEALLKNQNLNKNRVFNDALNKVFVEISKNIKFDNNNIKVLGNITKKRMQVFDWTIRYFYANQRFFFSITNSDKIIVAELENNLKINFSKTLKSIKLQIEKKINNINYLNKLVKLDEVRQIERILHERDNLMESNSFIVSLDKEKNMDNNKFNSLIEDILFNNQTEIRLMNIKDKIKNPQNISQINDLLLIIWEDEFKYNGINNSSKIEDSNKKINLISELNNRSKIILQKEIQYLKLQIEIIENLIIKQTQSVKQHKPVHLFLFSAIFIQFFLYSIFDIGRRFIKIISP